MAIFNITRVSNLWYFPEGTLPTAAEKIVNEMIREAKDTGTRIMCEESNSFEQRLLTILGYENPIIFKDLPYYKYLPTWKELKPGLNVLLDKYVSFVLHNPISRYQKKVAYLV